jgi:hypothetical protein
MEHLLGKVVYIKRYNYLQYQHILFDNSANIGIILVLNYQISFVLTINTNSLLQYIIHLSNNLELLVIHT